jgi:hypothetical protein
MERSEGFDLDQYAKLLREEAAQSAALSSLATRMRVSQQSSYNKMTRKEAVAPKMPWDGYAGTQKAA